MKQFTLQDEQNQMRQVTLELLIDKDALRPYGIRAKIDSYAALPECVEARERFFTAQEADAAMEMLCRFQVTPRTLCDVI